MFRSTPSYTGWPFDAFLLRSVHRRTLRQIRHFAPYWAQRRFLRSQGFRSVLAPRIIVSTAVPQDCFSLSLKQERSVTHDASRLHMLCERHLKMIHNDSCSFSLCLQCPNAFSHCTGAIIRYVKKFLIGNPVQ